MAVVGPSYNRSRSVGLAKSHATKLEPLRRCKPAVDDQLLRELVGLFGQTDVYPMDAAFEYTNPSSDSDKVVLFDKFKKLRDCGLLETDNGQDLFWAAINGGGVRLTPKGRFYLRRSSRTLPAEG